VPVVGNLWGQHVGKTRDMSIYDSMNCVRLVQLMVFRLDVIYKSFLRKHFGPPNGFLIIIMQYV
jgi:hypothetical protein